MPIKVLLLFMILYLQDCQQPALEVIELQISDSSIPEGIAVHPETKEIFVSSIHEDVITKSSQDGRVFETILTQKDNGYSFGVGMDIWKNELYALGKLNRGPMAILKINPFVSVTKLILLISSIS